MPPIARKLNREWQVGARHALYREDGGWYHHLERFPGALFDKYGYIIFDSKEAYENCSYLRHTQQLNVPGGIARIPGYVRMRTE